MAKRTGLVHGLAGAEKKGFFVLPKKAWDRVFFSRTTDVRRIFQPI
ncbi:hypothetical protein [Paenibacillus macerans]|nr:hypothetical protein [Paenibacillus macerans]